MAAKKRTSPHDAVAANSQHAANLPGLQQIDDLERCIVQAHDEKALLGVDAAELARFRPGVVAQAKAVCDRMRDEYRARNPQS